MSTPTLMVLAGPSGAGKSTVGGAYLRSAGLDYFDAEDFARGLQPTTSDELARALSLAWHEGRRRLREAITRRCSFALETTLGGATMAGLIDAAADRGFQVQVWYFGLSSPELHVDRATRRQSKNGISIPATLIESRWTRCRENLVALLPKLSGVHLFDNSAERAPSSVVTPPPRLVLDVQDARIVAPLLAAAADSPDWAKPLMEAAYATFLDPIH